MLAQNAFTERAVNVLIEERRSTSAYYDESRAIIHKSRVCPTLPHLQNPIHLPTYRFKLKSLNEDYTLQLEATASPVRVHTLLNHRIASLLLLSSSQWVVMPFGAAVAAAAWPVA